MHERAGDQTAPCVAQPQPQVGARQQGVEVLPRQRRQPELGRARPDNRQRQRRCVKRQLQFPIDDN